jgi:hypothetical protein
MIQRCYGNITVLQTFSATDKRSRYHLGMRVLFIVLRIAGTVAGIAAIVGQLITTYNFWQSAGISDKSSLFVNFFSFFTIDSNVLAIVVYAIGAVFLIMAKTDPLWLARLRLCAVTYMTVTFVVYNLLLRGIELPQGTTLAWSNEVLHFISPLLLIADWFFAPGRRRLEWKELGTVVVFPIVWVIYTLIRGPLADNQLAHKPTWYPYPFLDPSLSPEGYFSVAFYVVLIAGVVIGTGAGVIRVARTRERWPLTAH